MIQESEASPSMMIEVDTGKWNDIKKKLNLPIESSADVVADSLLYVLPLYEIYHRGLEWIDRQVFKVDAIRKGGIEQKG